jgi:alkylated DNA nucleotide flippase Atl1
MTQADVLAAMPVGTIMTIREVADAVGVAPSKAGVLLLKLSRSNGPVDHAGWRGAETGSKGSPQKLYVRRE